MDRCVYCGSDDLMSRGTNWQCKQCGRYPRKGQLMSESRMKESSHGWGEYTTTTSKRITTLEDLIRVCEIDTEYWEIDHWICNKYEIGAKDPSKELQIEPLFQVKVWLIKKVAEIEARNVLEDMKRDAKAFAPKYPKIEYKKLKDGMMYEIAMPDLQLGRLAWAEESGHDYDIKIARKMATDALTILLSYVKDMPIEKIMFPLGHDYFNSDTKLEETSHGTPQIEDTRWQKTYRYGRELAVWMIDACSAIAPVDIVIIPGNHDEQRMFYMGDALECWYHNNPNVIIDNRAKKRKYYQFKTNLIGLTHGYHEPIKKLPGLMAIEEPKMWAATTHREWHLGDKHNKKDFLFKPTDEGDGVTIRILRSLAHPSVWEFDNAFVGSLRAAEGFLWHPTNGLIGQFTAAPTSD